MVLPTVEPLDVAAMKLLKFPTRCIPAPASPSCRTLLRNSQQAVWGKDALQAVAAVPGTRHIGVGREVEAKAQSARPGGVALGVNDGSQVVPALARWIDQDGSIELPPLDPTPIFSGGRTLARLVSRHWRPVREQALERAGHACEVCGQPPVPGGRHAEQALHVHEAWRCDLQTRIQWLDRLWVLCWRCHKHAHARPVWQWPEPSPAKADWNRFRGLARQAVVDAEPRRLVLFTIELQRGREPIPDALAAAFARADQASLPDRIRRQVRTWFDWPLAQAFNDEPFAHRSLDAIAGAPAARLDRARLLADRAIALAQPRVRAALCSHPSRR